MATAVEWPGYTRRGGALHPVSGSASHQLAAIPEGIEVGVKLRIIGEGETGRRFGALIREALPYLADKSNRCGIHTAEDLRFALRAAAGLFRRIEYRIGGRAMRAMRYHTLSPACVGDRRTDRHTRKCLACLEAMLMEAPEREGKSFVVGKVRHMIGDIDIMLREME